MLAAVVNRNIGRAGLGRVSPSSRCTLGEMAGSAGWVIASGAWGLAAQRGLFRCMGSLPHSAVRNPLGQDATRAKASKNMEPQMHTDAH